MTRTSKSLIATLALAGALPLATLRAEDWPQYRGANHDGISTETVPLPWSSSGPKTLWRVPTLNGFSSFTVGEGEAFTIVNQTVGGPETCIALDANTGKQLWAAPLEPAQYDNGGDSGTPENNGGDGPRSTPIVSDGRVYVLTPRIVLFCLDAKSGSLVWKKDLVKENGAKNIGWKSAAAPVIEGDLVYVAGGGSGQSLLGINKKSGEVVWKTQDDQMTHATPVVATIQGVRQVIFFTQKGLVATKPDTGDVLWRYPFKYAVSTAASPVMCDDIVYCSAGYDVGGGACRIAKNGDKLTATEIWRIPGNKFVPNHWSTPVYKDGYLYGMFSFKRYGVGPLKCVDVKTGKVIWEHPNFGAGQVIMAKDKLLALADSGELVAVEATPTAYTEICRTHAVAGKCWSTPALSDGHVFVRSTKEGACLDLSGK